MELLNRYLQAVGFWLPRKQKQDILAELSEDLRSQIEEQRSGIWQTTERGRDRDDSQGIAGGRSWLQVLICQNSL